MEIPLDSLVAAFLKRKARHEKKSLPRWLGLTGLTPEVSAILQSYAKHVALLQGILRVHLDMRVWTEERKKMSNNQPRRRVERLRRARV